MRAAEAQIDRAAVETVNIFLGALAVILAGYAIIGKPFAYIGLGGPPFIGDLVMIHGLVVLVRSHCALAVFASLPSLLLGLLLVWTMLRTLPYLGAHGADALRDSAIIVYSAFSLVLTAILLENPGRMKPMMSFLVVLGTAMILLAPVGLVMSDAANFTRTEGQGLINVKPGTVGVHLAGAALVFLLGFRRFNLVLILMLVIGIGLVTSQNRGGFLAAMAAISVGAIATGRIRQLILLAVLALGALLVADALDISIPTNRGRDLGAGQILENITSVFGIGEKSLDNTKQWRLKWWESIITYTFAGPYFWVGKGFGVNLAIADGFLVGLELPSAPLLRSPHNAHMTILARSGVPGLTMWLLMLLSWSLLLFMSYLRAMRRNHKVWAHIFVLTFCYALAFVVDATFDVSLEGPMSGIWFWCVIGAGLGTALVYNAALAGVQPHWIEQVTRDLAITRGT